MNHHEIKNFLTVAEMLHFGRASEACNLSASALTRSIQRLEGELGQALFIRDKRTVQLTPAGDRFREYAHKALRDWQTVSEELSETGPQGNVSIYASVTAVYSVLPDLLMVYRQRYPDVKIELRTGAAEEAVDKVIAGEIDLAVAALPDRHLARIEFLPLITTRLVFVGPKDPTISSKTKENPDIYDSPLVLPRSGLSRSRVDQVLQQNAAKPTRITEVSGNEGILAMVRLGCGIGVVPELVLERSPFRNHVQIVKNAPELDPYIVGLCSTQTNLKRGSVSALWNLARKKSHLK